MTRFSDDPSWDWPQQCPDCGAVLCDCTEAPEPTPDDELARAELDETRAEGEVLDAADELIAALRRLVRVPEGVRPALEALEAASSQLARSTEHAATLRRRETQRADQARRASRDRVPELRGAAAAHRDHDRARPRGARVPLVRALLVVPGAAMNDDAINPRIVLWLRSIGCGRDLLERDADGDLRRAPCGLPWTVAFMLWIQAQWRAWANELGFVARSGRYAHEVALVSGYTAEDFDAWLSRGIDA